MNTPGLTGATLAAKGLVEASERGFELLRQSAETLIPTPARLAHAEALLLLAGIPRRHRQRAEAREIPAGRSTSLTGRAPA